MMMKSLLRIAALLGGFFIAQAAHAQSFTGTIASGNLYGNATASAAKPSGSTVTAILDRALGSTRGSILERGASGWAIVGPGSTAGLPWVSNGAGADPAYQILGIVGGGTNCSAASGTCLDNITGFSSTGFLKRTGAGAYSFIADPLPAGNGGSGVASPTAHSLLQAEGASAFGVIAAATGGNIPIDQGAGLDWASKALSGDATLAASGALTITANAVTNAKAAQGGAYTIKGNATGATANEQDFTIGGLTNKPSPATTDLLILQDQAASGALKYCTLAQCIAAVSSGVTSLNTLTGAVTLLTEAQGRLTLQANTPVMTTSQSAQTTLRYDAYIGNQVPYFNGTNDALDTIASNEVTDAMVSAASAGQVVSGNVYDVWWVHSGANRICLAMSAAAGGGGGWASDTGGSNTARGTGYSQLDRITRPYITNKNAIANCFNGATNYGSVAVNQATYLGTVYASANGQVSYTLGAAASGGSAALLGVWNMYNRVIVGTTVSDTGASYTYTSNVVRQARGSAGNQIQFVLGLAEDSPQVSMSGSLSTTANAGAFGTDGVGFDSTTSFGIAGGILFAAQAAVVAQGGITNAGVWAMPSVGFHTLSANEQGDNTHANSFDPFGTNVLQMSLRM